MNRLLVMLIGLVLSSAAHAQDSLQQWRDSATQAMNEFRSVKKGRIEANGWQFVAGTLSAEEVPISDMFIRGVKTEQGSIRSAYLLNAFYLPVADPELPVYQSTKMLVWFDCKEGNFQQRIVERYPSADGSANPVSRDTEMHDTLGIELPGADPRSVEKALLPAVCSRRRG